MIEILVVLTVVVLGIAAGALIAEAFILVPMWRSMEASAFLAWYELNAERLLRFFGSLEVAALLVPGLATATSWFQETSGLAYLGLATGLSILVLVSFPIYFRDANASFAQGTIDLDDVPDELRRWALWHRGRTLIALLAFIVSIMAAKAL